MKSKCWTADDIFPFPFSFSFVVKLFWSLFLFGFFFFFFFWRDEMRGRKFWVVSSCKLEWKKGKRKEERWKMGVSLQCAFVMTLLFTIFEEEMKQFVRAWSGCKTMQPAALLITNQYIHKNTHFILFFSFLLSFFVFMEARVGVSFYHPSSSSYPLFHTWSTTQTETETEICIFLYNKELGLLYFPFPT